MANRLAQESSPYLLQHQNNPVDWYPWGEEALTLAKQEDKPIFLSIGYSACHWCHVMEHESFENDQIAAQLNQKFVCIKVDREERPDLDQIYMNAVMAMTGHGGWPMSVFLTPDVKPFFGGTYWPPQADRGMPGFDHVIERVHEAWVERREQAIEQAEKLTQALRQSVVGDDSTGEISQQLLFDAAAKLERIFDFKHGGFGAAPKFPHSMDLLLLLRVWKRCDREGVLDMVRLNLDKMAQGGIYDHLAGGFARYSVDARWLVPHFEKMLYDNGLLAGVYLDGYVVTKDEAYARVVRETLDYTLNYMTDDLGGFHSTEDADSEGEEGKFYVWTPEEIKELLGDARAERFCYVYDVSDEGNFEGKNILNLPKTIEQCAALHNWNLAELETELAESRAALLAARDQRIRPGKDDKILVSWNALMIDSMARAAGVLDEPRYLAAATRATEFILGHLRRGDGRLLHTWRRGNAQLDAYLDDYTYLINALVSLYEASFDEKWIDEAIGFSEIVLRHFIDRDSGGFFFTADDHEPLIARNKDYQDSSVPSGNSMAATALFRLGKLCGRQDLVDAAQSAMAAAMPMVQRAPSATGQVLVAMDMSIGPFHEIAVVGDASEPATKQVLAEFRRRYHPNCVIASRSLGDAYQSPHLNPLFEGKQANQQQSPTVFICQDFACQAPLTEIDQIMAKWDDLAHAVR